MISILDGLILSIILFFLGALCIVIRRNVLFIFIGIEIMMNALALAFIFIGHYWNQSDGQIMYILIITLAASEASVGLALLIQLYRRYKTLDIDILSRMRG
ncbi:NADH-quinone oxidoreductase subunit NuoK [Buchnera aphidicola (Formosaphis micheliae)]|uniref:NADH-quinone oxidoreductase subunit NuoK n=1 Tax=Buchnera aphidicola TaxID=9 RepID=UPI0031B86538